MSARQETRDILDSDDIVCGRVTIDLGALVGNWRMLARRAETAATAAVVKADAYGIGLEPAARALAETGCQTFFVALADEGLRLRTAVRDAIIYVLDGFLPAGAGAFANARLRPVLNSRVTAGVRARRALPWPRRWRRREAGLSG